MTGTFSVDPEYVAGYGEHSATVSDQMVPCYFNLEEARPTTGYDGLMSLLVTPVDTYVEDTRWRVTDRNLVLSGLRDTLNLVAWEYHTTDVDSYTRIEEIPMPPGPPGPPPTREVILDFPAPYRYPSGTTPTFDIPGHEDPPIQDLIDEVGGSINAIDWVVKEVSGWSPVEAIVEPLAGNWTELERAAEILTQCGNGFEQCAENLKSQISTLGLHWSGGAAIAAENWATRMSNAIEIEGPINRLVGQVLIEVAGEVEAAAQFMVTTLKTAVDKIATAVATGWIPFVGWYKVYDAVRTVINVFNEAKELVESLQSAIETVQTVVDAAKDPVGFASGAAEEQLAPLLQGGQNALDLAALDPSDITEAPTEDYDAGENPRRAS